MRHLLPLALEALGDGEARAVLGDAVMEADWAPLEAMRLVFDGPAHSRKWFHLASTIPRPGDSPLYPSELFARACVAYLLFEDWSDEMWPAAARCWRDIPIHEILRGIYPDNGFPEDAYEGRIAGYMNLQTRQSDFTLVGDAWRVRAQNALAASDPPRGLAETPSSEQPAPRPNRKSRRARRARSAR